MREIRGHVTDIDRHLEEALRAKQQLDAERWRTELRPRVLRLFAARARKLAWSRALLKLVVEELYPDDLFAELVGRLDRVHGGTGRTCSRSPSRSAIAGGVTGSRGSPDASACRLPRARFPTAVRPFTVPDHHVADSPARLDPVKALRCAPTPRGGAHGLDGALGRARFGSYVTVGEL